VRAAGATADYRQADVRDPEAVRRLVQDVYRRYGRLDGVVHGAGVIEDALLEQKSPESFRRVLETKVVGALALAAAVVPGSLRFLVFFSSVAGRFGNRGQVDYAAANQVLDKLALVLADRLPGRVVSIGWGPWASAGMVSEAVRARFVERGVRLVPAAAGARMLAEELRPGSATDAEVVIGDGPWPVAPPAEAGCGRLPLVDPAALVRHGDGGVELEVELDPRVHRYLEDHRLDGRPVLPAAMALELVAEVAQAARPDRIVTGVRELRVLKGVIVDPPPARLLVVAAPRLHPDGGSPSTADVDVTISAARTGGPLHYSAVVEASDSWPVAPPPLPPATAPNAESIAAEEAYGRYMFHGPAFQCIQEIPAIDETGAVATMLPSDPDACLAGPCAERPGGWLTDPVLVDGGPQLAIVWSRLHRDRTPLPARFGHFRRFAPVGGGPMRCDLRVLPESTAEVLLGDVTWTDDDGRVVAVLEGMELILSPALNRLAGASR
jgi:NAD(P)-dependent dehydrogenase (short-subunit alcohol dehydrogenase family)